VDTDYKVSLDIFEGPLDLLLYLIKKDEVDIYDISLERVTKQYLEYMDTFKLLNIELASDFIVMAANLMYLKSRTLLPRHQQPPEEDVEEEDPRWELIRQLIEYKKFKDAAGYLQKRELDQEKYYANLPEPLADSEEEEKPSLAEVGIFDLIQAFQSVLKRFDDESTLREIEDDQFTVNDKIDYLLHAVDPGGTIRFSALFSKASSRGEVIVTFLALLELMKLNYFRIEQAEALGDIEIMRVEVA